MKRMIASGSQVYRDQTHFCQMNVVLSSQSCVKQQSLGTEVCSMYEWITVTIRVWTTPHRNQTKFATMEQVNLLFSVNEVYQYL